MYTSYDRGFRAPTFVENSKSQTLGIQIDQATARTSTRSRRVIRTWQRSARETLASASNCHPPVRRTLAWIGTRFASITPSARAILPRLPRTRQARSCSRPSPMRTLGYLDTNGFEGTFRQSLPTKAGTFTLSADWAYVNSFKLGTPGESPVNGAGNNFTLTQPFGGSLPRWKGNTTLDWAYSKFDAALTWQFTGRMHRICCLRLSGQSGFVQPVQPDDDVHGLQALGRSTAVSTTSSTVRRRTIRSSHRARWIRRATTSRCTRSSAASRRSVQRTSSDAFESVCLMEQSLRHASRGAGAAFFC